MAAHPPRRHVLLLLLAAFALALVPAGAAAAPGDELLLNPGLEAGTGTAPLYWASSTWGTNTTAFSRPTDAHTGGRSARVDITSYTDGDSKWIPDDASMVTVTPGTYYRFSDWYKSDVTTAVSVYYETATDVPGEGHWANLFSGIAPSPDHWTQYKTGFTMPAGAVRAYFAHFLAHVGFLQTDDYSMTEATAPPGFAHPMVSLTFDDGSQAFYDRARGPLDAHGFKTTQYVPTQGLQAPLDPFMMTPAEIKALAGAGHEIGSHSITHPDLTTLGDSALADELQQSRTTLRAIVPGDPVDDFAYPFGSYDARVITAAKAAGYRSARSVEEGYNSREDTELYDIRGQNMTSATTTATFKSWVDYAKAHNYWLVVIYHEVVPDNAPVCTDPETVDPCLGPYDTTVGRFTEQLQYLGQAGLGPDVVTVRAALDAIAAGTGTPPPTDEPPTTDTPPAGGGTTPPAAPPAQAPAPNVGATGGTGATGGGSAPAADRTGPRLTVTAPRTRTFTVGSRLRVRVTSSDPSGVRAVRITLRRGTRAPARRLRNGQAVRLTRTGTYTIRITATDRLGNVTVKSIRITVRRVSAGPRRS